MRRVIGKPRGLKLIRYTARFIDITEYLDSVPRAKLIKKIGMTELNEKHFNSIPNSWIKQASVQVFDCGSITFLNPVNMF